MKKRAYVQLALLPLAFLAAMGIAYWVRYWTGPVSRPEVLLLIAFAYLLYPRTLRITHELGHLAFGKLSGYQFVLFRVFGRVFLRENGKLVCRRDNIKKSCSCWMEAPVPMDGRYPFVLYTLGGALMNLILSIVFFAVIPLVAALPLLAVFLAFFSALCLLSGLSSMAPQLTYKRMSDGATLRTLRKNEQARQANWLQMHINALLVRGTRYRDMPAQWFDLPKAGLFDSPIIYINAFDCLNYLLDTHDLAAAKDLAEFMQGNAEHMMHYHRNLLLCKALFLALVCEGHKEAIEPLYTPQLEKHIRATAQFPSHLRLRYALAKLHHHDPQAAEQAREAFEKVCASYPFLGDIPAEHELMQLVDDIAEKRGHTS